MAEGKCTDLEGCRNSQEAKTGVKQELLWCPVAIVKNGPGCWARDPVVARVLASEPYI